MDIGREPKELRIGDRWFVDLDEHLDVEGLEKIYPQLCLGVARALPLAEPVVIGSRDALYHQNETEISIAMEELKVADPLLQQLLAATDRQVAYDYVKFRYESISLGKKILLRTYNNYHAGFAMKHLARVNHDTQAYKFFPELRQWISDSGAFSEVGRIIIFLTERDARSEIHCDYADGRSRKDQFLWLNPGRRKKFFVLNENFEKQYLTGVSNTFDSACWHGGDPTPFATFTIRIDGKFSTAFKQKAGVETHFD